MRDWLQYAERRFRHARLRFGHGTHGPGEESAWLLAHVLRIAHEDLPASGARELNRTQARTAHRLIEARVRTRQPLAYLLKEAWLGDLRFYVDRRAIVPRSYIAELLRERLAPWVVRPARIRRVLELCTGSGCLGILAALAFPQSIVRATDLSRAALAVARRNVEAYRLVRRVKLARADLFGGLAAERYDLIVANPPYVAAATMSNLPAEFTHEPRLALAGGNDGLHFVRRILQEAARFLRPGGILVVEVGHHRRRLERAFPRIPFVWPQTSAGYDRVFLLSREDLPGQA